MDRTIGFLEKIMRFTGIRHRVISSNIANSDTPGYKGKDVSFQGLLRDEGLRLMRSNSRHLTVTEIEAGLNANSTEQASWKDGNNVELDMEVAKMTENSLLHQASIRILNTRLRMYRNAIRGTR